MSKKPSDPKAVREIVRLDEGEPDEATVTKKLSGQPEERQGPPSRRSRPYLIVLAGTNVGQMHRLTGSEIILGRGGRAAVQLEDDGISRRHARIRVTGDETFLEDLGSGNGTHLNGVKIQQSRLNDGDKIRIGSTTILKFTYTDDLDEAFQKHMYDAALRDGLTQTFNKAYLLHRLETECAYARRHSSPLALIMLDVDYFKRVNDTRGHLAGDQVLTELARLLHSTLRAEDVLARYGGEEFSVICRGLTLNLAGHCAERLRVVVEAKGFVFEGVAIPITVSLGVASYPEMRVDGSVPFIAAADAALLAAKRAGRNRVMFAQPA